MGTQGAIADTWVEDWGHNVAGCQIDLWGAQKRLADCQKWPGNNPHRPSGRQKVRQNGLRVIIMKPKKKIIRGGKGLIGKGLKFALIVFRAPLSPETFCWDPPPPLKDPWRRLPSRPGRVRREGVSSCTQASNAYSLLGWEIRILLSLFERYVFVLCH